MAKFSYKELGLSNTKEMFAKANREGYSVPAFNFNNMEQLQAIMEACVEMGSPVILQVSTGALKYIGKEYISLMAKAAVEYARAKGSNIPVALHLDHGPDLAAVKTCIDLGFSSVMIDGSHHAFEENVRLSKEVVEYAHQFDVTVEGELGILAGVEDDVCAEQHTYTQPEEVEEFLSKTGIDSLAIAIGTSHGAHKFKPGEDPKIRIDILREIETKIPGFPIVLHGSSSVPAEFIGKINQFGGKIADAIGIDDKQLRDASSSAVAKINVDTDGRLAFTAGIREVFTNKPSEFDPRKYIAPAKQYMKDLYKQKIEHVFGSIDAYQRGN